MLTAEDRWCVRINVQYFETTCNFTFWQVRILKSEIISCEKGTENLMNDIRVVQLTYRMLECLQASQILLWWKFTCRNHSFFIN